MATALEELRVLQIAERVADSLWKEVAGWDLFARDVVGGQLARAADSIGANIAESFGRFNYGEKVQFLYYARGSLFETKYWLNRSLGRGLMKTEAVQLYSNDLTDVAKQINRFANSLKTQKRDSRQTNYGVRETRELYGLDEADATEIFTCDDLNWLAISNL